MDTYRVDKGAFAERLNQALDRIGAPGPRRGRQTWLAKKIGVTQKGARKWLLGLSVPEHENRQLLARLCRVTPHWLYYGYGEAREAPGAYAIGQISDEARDLALAWQNLPP